MKSHEKRGRPTAHDRPGTSKILFHDIGGGLGHQVRLVAIAQAIRRLSNYPVAILALSESHSVDLWKAWSIPVLPLANRDRLARLGWLYDVPQPSKMLVNSVQAIVTAFRPHVVVHDTFVWHPLVQSAKEGGARQAAIIRTPPNVEQFWSEGTISWDILDTLIIISDDYMPDPKVPATIASKIVRVNGVKKPNLRSSISGRIRVGKRTVVVTAGGGYLLPGDDYFEGILQVLDRFEGIEVIVVLGPCYQRPIVISKRHTISVLPFSPDLDYLLNRAGLVICRGGYNTILELSCLDTPTICIPQQTHYDSQLDRCLAAASSRPHWRVIENMTELSDAVHAWRDGILVPPQVSCARTPPDGALEAAEEILRLC